MKQYRGRAKIHLARPSTQARPSTYVELPAPLRLGPPLPCHAGAAMPPPTCILRTRISCSVCWNSAKGLMRAS